MAKQNILTEFILTEIEHYDDRDVNRFSASLWQATRYYDFLQLIIKRYRIASRNYEAHARRMMATTLDESSSATSGEVAGLIEAGQARYTRLHLEIESFYMFATILLNKIANLVEDYFGQARQCSLISHNELRKSYKKFANEKGITIPKELGGNLERLQTTVVDYRNKQVAHLRNPRVLKGTAFDKLGNSKIVLGYIYPRETDKLLSSPKVIDDVMQDIDFYIRQVITLIKTNRSKSRFKLKMQSSLAPIPSGI